MHKSMSGNRVGDRTRFAPTSDMDPAPSANPADVDHLRKLHR
jgi:hypothetical protein